MSVESRGRAGSGGYDAGGLLIVPAIVDLHGDAFERQIHPRPGVTVELEIALAETDRQMAANGIATAFHGLTVTWEPGTRDLKAARAFLHVLARVKPRLQCDTKLHLRHEALTIDTAEEEADWIRQGLVDLLAFNDQSSMVERALEGPQLPSNRLEKLNIPETEYRTLAESALARRGDAPDSIRRLAAVARAKGVPLASHDDDTPAMRAWFHQLGCHICEFPCDQATAEEAMAAGDALALGGPNILLGRSHCGRVAAAEMIRQRLCTIVCSDYYYPSILYAPFRLAASGIVPLAEAWDLVSRGPAQAVGLDDRGTIETGRRADLLVVDDRDPLHPIVRTLFVEAVPAYSAGRETAVAGQVS